MKRIQFPSSSIIVDDICRRLCLAGACTWLPGTPLRLQERSSFITHAPSYSTHSFLFKRLLADFITCLKTRVPESICVCIRTIVKQNNNTD
jgi:hypothetical protein